MPCTIDPSSLLTSDTISWMKTAPVSQYEDIGSIIAELLYMSGPYSQNKHFIQVIYARLVYSGTCGKKTS